MATAPALFFEKHVSWSAQPSHRVHRDLLRDGLGRCSNAADVKLRPWPVHAMAVKVCPLSSVHIIYVCMKCFGTRVKAKRAMESAVVNGGEG